MRLGKYLSLLTKPELEEIIEKCGITEENKTILRMKATRCTAVEIAHKLNISVATVERRVKDIQKLIERIEDMAKEKINIPPWEKVTMTIDEAAEYSNIGINKLRELTSDPRCNFVIYVGKKKLIKRKEFEKHISENVEL